MPPALIAIVFIAGLLVLLPARRLRSAGWSRAVVGTYYLALSAGFVAVAWAPGRTRFLLPILIAAYLAPFVTLPAAVDRLLGRPRPHEPRNITPPDAGADSGSR